MVDREYEKMIVHSAIYDRVVAAARGQLSPASKPVSPRETSAGTVNSTRSGK